MAVSSASDCCWRKLTALSWAATTASAPWTTLATVAASGVASTLSTAAAKGLSRLLATSKSFAASALGRGIRKLFPFWYRPPCISRFWTWLMVCRRLRTASASAGATVPVLSRCSRDRASLAIFWTCMRWRPARLMTRPSLCWPTVMVQDATHITAHSRNIKPREHRIWARIVIGRLLEPGLQDSCTPGKALPAQGLRQSQSTFVLSEKRGSGGKQLFQLLIAQGQPGAQTDDFLARVEQRVIAAE